MHSLVQFYCEGVFLGGGKRRKGDQLALEVEVEEVSYKKYFTGTSNPNLVSSRGVQCTKHVQVYVSAQEGV